MADNSFSPQQIDRLINYASQRLGTTPQQLKAVFQQQGLAGLSQLTGDPAAFSSPEAAKAQELQQNREQAAQLLDDPRVQSLLKQQLGD